MPDNPHGRPAKTPQQGKEAPPDDTTLQRDTSISREASSFDETAPWLPGATPAPPAATPDPGIPGFTVERVLGKGGMGVVYLARQEELNRLVALKTVRGFLDEQSRNRFAREARAIAAISHANVVPIYEVGYHDGAPYMVMEYLAKGNLESQFRERLARFEEAAKIVAELARAAQALHEVGVVHRDLKPANVLIGDDGAVKIGDLGLAKILESEEDLTPTEAVLGTPSYMAPEQAESGVSVAASADVYALGAILYRLLTGRPPFLADTVVDTILLVRNEDALSPRQIRSDAPRDLETICLKCLQKKPERRYAAASELAEDLERFMRGEPIQARRISATERAWKWVRRRPTQAALLGATSSAAMVIIGILTVSRGLLLHEQQQTNAFAQVAVNASRDLTTFGAEDLLYVAEADEIRRRMLNRALDANRRMIELRGDLPQFRFETASTHLNSGQLSYSLGEHADAERSFNAAISLMVDAEEVPHRKLLSETYRALGNLKLGTGDFAAAKDSLTKAVSTLESLPRDDAVALMLVHSLESEASLCFQNGETIAGGEFLRNAEAILSTVSAGSDEAMVEFIRWRLRTDLAELYATQADWDRAQRILDVESEEIDSRLESLAGRIDVQAIRAKFKLQQSFVRLALDPSVEAPAAAKQIEEQLDVLRDIVQRYPAIVDLRLRLARSLFGAANLLSGAAATRQRAMRYYQEIIELQQSGASVPELSLLAIVSKLETGLAAASLPLIGLAAADAAWAAAVREIEALPAGVQRSYLAQLQLSRALSYQGQTQYLLKRPNKALPLLLQASGIQDVLVDKTNNDFRLQRHIAWTQAYLGELKISSAETMKDAGPHFRKAHEAAAHMQTARFPMLRSEGLRLAAQSLYGEAKSLSSRREYDKAAAALNASIKNAKDGVKEFPRDAMLRQWLEFSQQSLFQTHRDRKDHAAMIAVLKEKLLEETTAPGELVDIAHALVQTLEILVQDRKLSDDEQRSRRREYVQYAIDVCKAAIAKKAISIERLRSSDDWSVLRESEAFREFLASP